MGKIRLALVGLGLVLFWCVTAYAAGLVIASFALPRYVMPCEDELAGSLTGTSEPYDAAVADIKRP